MIQFSKPRRTLGKSMEPFRRFETTAKDYLTTGAGPSPGLGPSGTPSRFDASFYRTHDAMGYIGGAPPPMNAGAVPAQVPYATGLPMFGGPSGPYAGVHGGRMAGSGPGGAGRRTGYGGYAASIISQDQGAGQGGDSVYGGAGDTASVIGSSIGGGGVPTGSVSGSSVLGGSSIAYSQSDRLRRGRRGSTSSSWAGTNSELGGASAYDYKSTDDGVDDDVKSQYTAQSQAGVTVY